MRRAFVWFVQALALTLSATSAFGQYPYPYAQPMPVPYGAPMPAYMPNPMMTQPMPYGNPPMMPAPVPMAPNGPQKVFVFGPVDGGVPATAQSRRDLPPAAPTPAPIRQVQEVRTLPVPAKSDLPPEATGPESIYAIGEMTDPLRWDRPTRGKGHFIAEVGASFLAPFSSNRLAYTSTTGANASYTDFPNWLEVGPRTSVGYVFHTGWGVRSNYAYLNGVINQSAVVNPGSNTRVSSAFLTINAPSFASNNGIGFDNLDFHRRLQSHTADFELIKEGHFLDTTFLTAVGTRYGRMMQSYSATRTNQGGIKGALSVALDREDLDSTSYFDGFGPTVAFEVIHPLGSHGFSAYGSVRGSFLWGIDRYGQTYRNQFRSVNNGVPTFIDQTLTPSINDHRFVPIIEPEVGLQWGGRIGRCYVYGRLGAEYMRWWDVGTPITLHGGVNFVGGTARLGIVY